MAALQKWVGVGGWGLGVGGWGGGVGGVGVVWLRCRWQVGLAAQRGLRGVMVHHLAWFRRKDLQAEPPSRQVCAVSLPSGWNQGHNTLHVRWASDQTFPLILMRAGRAAVTHR